MRQTVIVLTLFSSWIIDLPHTDAFLPLRRHYKRRASPLRLSSFATNEPTIENDIRQLLDETVSLYQVAMVEKLPSREDVERLVCDVSTALAAVWEEQKYDKVLSTEDPTKELQTRLRDLQQLVELHRAIPLDTEEPIVTKTISTSTAHESILVEPTLNNVAGSKISGAPMVLVFDTETSGKVNFEMPSHDPCQPQLVQLAILLVDTSDWSRRMSVSILVQLEDGISIDSGAQETHGVSIDSGAQETNGISFDDCSKFGVPRGVALHLFHSALKRADVLVAHNLRFDELVMQAVACREKHHDANSVKQVGERPGLQRVCTMISSTDVLKLPGRFGKYKWPSLPEAFAHFTDGQDIENWHDAMVDAEACLTVFRGLVESGSLILEPVLERAEITLDPDHGQSEVLTEADENVEKSLLRSLMETLEKSKTAPLGNSLFPLAKRGELLVTPNAIGFDVGGDTYKHRKALKVFGGQWNPQRKCWFFQGHEYLATVYQFAGYEMHKQ